MTEDRPEAGPVQSNTQEQKEEHQDLKAARPQGRRGITARVAQGHGREPEGKQGFGHD